MRALSFAVGLLLLTSCRTAGGGNDAAEVKDLPDFFQPDRVLAYRGYGPGELDAIFTRAEAPSSIPDGYASGIHIIPSGTKAPVPLQLTVVTKKFWKGKTFKGTAAVMTDELLGPDLGVGAQLRIESLRDSLKRYNWDAKDQAAVIDDKPSLITDYKGYKMFDKPSLLTADTKGWVDECRVVEADAPAVWMCRSTYNGIFWGHVILQMQ